MPAVPLSAAAQAGAGADRPPPEPLRPLGKYRWPAMPAEDAARTLWTRLWQLLKTDDDAPLIAEDRLQRAACETLDALAPTPACGPLQRELDAAFADWAGVGPPLSSSPPSRAAARVQLVVLPPGDGDGNGGGPLGEDGVIAAWADRHGLDRLPPPARAALLTARDADPAGLVQIGEGGGPVVVPRLERWFLRHHRGLGAVRALLEAVDRADRRVLIGCNSWAWALLCKAVEANLVLPNGRTFAAFDAPRLERWFRELAARGEVDRVAFRLSATGRTILSSAADGAAEDYFRTLAAHSLGIPWVAWSLWRRSLRSEKEAADKAAAEHAAAGGDAPAAAPERDAPKRKTLWVAALEEFTLPVRHEAGALLALQALLIHGPLTEAELERVAPLGRRAGLLSALVGAGFVRREGGALACAPAAYPAVRAGLSAAGFPVDTL